MGKNCSQRYHKALYAPQINCIDYGCNLNVRRSFFTPGYPWNVLQNKIRLDLGWAEKRKRIGEKLTCLEVNSKRVC